MASIGGILGTVGKVASLAGNVAAAPITVPLNLAGVDTTPGYGIRNVIKTQLGGSPSSSAQSSSYSDPTNYAALANQNAAASVTSGGGSSDPYAAYGGQANYNNLLDNYNQQYGNIQSSTNDAAAQGASQYNNSILDYLDSVKSQQNNINQQAVQNELAREQGVQSVTAGVGRGIRSGGVMLANKNAGNSSAAEAIAQAYGDVGRQQLSGIGNQFAQGQGAIAQSQADLTTQEAAGQRHLAASHDQIVNGVVDAAQQQLAALDATAANASLPQRINIEQEKANIRANVLGQLQQYDQTLQQGISGIQQTNPDDVRAQARTLAQAGQAPANAFQYTTDTPAQLQGTGPFSSELPIFTFPSSLKKQTV